MKKEIKVKGERGFTLVETLVVTAILIILLGLSVVAAAYYRDLLKITELDNAAREIYMAAENRAVLLSNAGRLKGLVKQGDNGVRIPLTAGDEGGGEGETDAYYISSNKAELTQLLPMGSVDPALRDGQFYIVYEPVSGCVTDVFYTEGEIANLADAGFQAFYDQWTVADRSARMRLEPMLGYYGGGSAQGEIVEVLSPKVQVITDNGERLTVTVSCWLPDGVGMDAASLEVSLSCGGQTVMLTDTMFSARKIENFSENASGGVNYIQTWVLDELGSENQFKKLFQYTTRPSLGGDFQVAAVLSSTDGAFEPVEAGGGNNSLFEESTHDGVEAYIKDLRHLQNLDEDFSGVAGKTGAVQVADILCLGNETYGDYQFQPIRNDSLLSYDGDEKEIRGLYVAEMGNAGLFSTATGVTFTDIRLVNAAVSAQGSGNAGALAGQTVNAAFNGCWVYWESEQGDSLSGILGSDAAGYHPQVIGTNAGGLVGGMSGGAIQNCLAATIVSGTQAAGGLIGRAAAGSTVSITNSYADCYLTGGAAAGLIGDLRGGCMLTRCYAAGFIVGADVRRAAGLCLGAGTTSANSTYSVMRYPDQFGPTGSARENVYMLTQSAETDGFSNTYYLNSGAVGETSVAHMRKDYSEMTAGSFKQDMGGSFAWKDAGDSHPYNLREHLSLVVYSFPGLASLPHYGDWGAQFQEPSLVYYEQYKNGTYGFSGGNARYLVGELKDENILSDGYAVAFLTTDMQQSGQAAVTYTDFSSSGPKQAAYSVGGTSETEKLIQAEWTNDEGNTASYYLALLPEDMVNAETAVEEIYQYLRFDLTIGGETSSGVYFYNPHFAETVIPYAEKEGADIQWDAETARTYAREQLLEKGQDILSVRTPRHLYDLGRFEAYYHNASHTCTFYQRLDLDYATYIGYGLFTVRTGAHYAQTPIGSITKPFIGAYDGGCHAIKSVIFQIPGGGGNRYGGLFGCSAGTLRSIVYRMDLDQADALTAARDDGSGALYMGGLVGVNQGTLDNCAVSGVYFNGMTFGSTVYLGGLVGQNEGVIRASAAECAGIVTDNSRSGRASLGGLVGENASTITGSYAVGRLDATVDGTSSAWVCGFAGNNSGNIISSYAAVDLKSSGLNVETYGFCAGTQSGSSYLNEGNFTYRESSYTASYARDEESAEGKRYGVLTGNPAAVAGMSLGAYADGGEQYPYPTALVDADKKPVHYGQFPEPMELGQMGVYYWEKLNSGSYYISLLAVKPSNNGEQTITKLTTLSTAHDDGLVVTDYGYGCYEAEAVEGAASVVLKAENINYQSAGGTNGEFTKDAPSEATVNRALKTLMPGFEFHSYLSFDPNGTANRGLYPTGGPNGTLTLTQGPLSVAFELNPHFADSVTVKTIGGKDPEESGWAVSSAAAAKLGTAANPYGVRSVAQLELINWNNTAQNTRTVLGEESGNYTQFPYLSYSYSGESAARNYVWKQSHDLDGGKKSYTPIAEYYDASSSNTGQLYGWFGGSYDGQGYRITDVSIQAGIEGKPSSVAGLFGVVYNGTLKDIILYSSDGQGRITGSYHTGTKSQWSATGGLAGVAASSGSDSAIINCAVAGYTIDATFYNNVTDSNTWGGAEIGGLVGFTNCDLKGCSAVTRIELTKIKANDNVRVGGLVGSAQSTISNSYAGGRIVFAQDCDVSFGSTTAGGDTFEAFLYIGGLVGGSYFKPLNADGNTIGPRDKAKWDVTLENCYSFVELPARTSPEAKGKIKALYALGGVGELNSSGTQDNKADHGKSEITNSYYLGTVVLTNNTSSDLIAESKKNTAIRLTFRTDLEKAGLTSVTYQQLANQEPIEKTVDGKTQSRYIMQKDGQAGWLTAFSPVTTTIGGFSVAGKYSYAPASRLELQGMDYPFPTILTRNDANHVHYGEWPLSGIERASGGKPIALDLLSRPVHKEALALSAGVYDDGGVWSVDGYDGTIIRAEAAQSAENPKEAQLMVEAIKTGTTKLIIHYRVDQTDYLLRLTVNVTEELELFPRETALFPGGSFVLPLDPRGRDPDPEPDENGEIEPYPLLPVKYLSIDEANALDAGLNCAVAQKGFEAGEDGGGGKKPAIALSADAGALPGPAVVNVGYTYVHGRDGTNEGISYTKTGSITVVVLEPPEAVFNEADGTYTLDFSPFAQTHGLSIRSAVCESGDEAAAVMVDGTVITISDIKEGTQWVPLSVSLTMDGLEHNVKLEVSVEDQMGAPNGPAEGTQH